ncbi:hypothetical protein BGZ60DRAFT_419918 [Tricladium varicosporioides]|nr:hypothetical protein BGZ60DRAFT_419918 [Hymenoscyphus varicosporioides]
MRPSQLLVVLSILASAHNSLTSTSLANTPEPSMTVACPPIIDRLFCIYGCACKCVDAKVCCTADHMSCGHDDGRFCEERCSCLNQRGDSKLEDSNISLQQILKRG